MHSRTPLFAAIALSATLAVTIAGTPIPPTVPPAIPPNVPPAIPPNVPPTAPPAAAPAFPPAGDATAQKPEFPPRSYNCAFTATAPALDGTLDDAAWSKAAWTEDFLDIQGPKLPTPRYRTRAKMLWDGEFLYSGAEISDAHIWGTLAKHDEIVFRDNDFEVFIDPDGDAREYYELEVNALATIFDLYLHRRYKDDGPAEHGWNAEGLKTFVHINGTLNDPTDKDTGWSLEWAIPWSAFKPPNMDRPGFGEKERGSAVPKPGDEWRLNFSRVQWDHNWEGKIAPKPVAKPINDSFKQTPADAEASAPRPPAYEKTKGKAEDNWVWTPQWQIDMHDPRWWGRLKFVKP